MGLYIVLKSNLLILVVAVTNLNSFWIIVLDLFIIGTLLVHLVREAEYHGIPWTLYGAVRSACSGYWASERCKKDERC